MSAIPASLVKLPRRAVKAARLLRYSEWRRGLLQGVGATIEHDGLPFLESYGTVIDVGAHKGQFALYARHRFPNAMLFCFEPLQEPRAKLTALMSGDSKLSIVPAAVGAASGSALMHVSNSDDSSSLLEITGRQSSVFPGTEEVDQREIRVTTLDEHFHHIELDGPILLKIDVQGFEMEVLKGASSVLGLVDTVLVECSFTELYRGQPLFDDLYRFLVGCGFTLQGGNIGHKQNDVWLQGDFIFVSSRASAHLQGLRAA